MDTTQDWAQSLRTSKIDHCPPPKPTPRSNLDSPLPHVPSRQPRPRSFQLSVLDYSSPPVRDNSCFHVRTGDDAITYQCGDDSPVSFPVSSVDPRDSTVAQQFERSSRNVVLQVTQGEHGVVAVCGDDNAFNESILFGRDRDNLLFLSAQTLFQSMDMIAASFRPTFDPISREKIVPYEVHISWCHILDDTVVDVLREVVDHKHGSPHRLAIRVDENGHTVIRDALEIRLSCADDALRVVSKAESFLARSSPDGHMVVVFTVKAPHTSHIGRLSLVQFSKQGMCDFMDPVRAGDPGADANQSQSWGTTLSSVLYDIATLSNPAPPFHKSKLVLILRDALQGRACFSVHLALSSSCHDDDDKNADDDSLHSSQQIESKHDIPWSESKLDRLADDPRSNQSHSRASRSRSMSSTFEDVEPHEPHRTLKGLIAMARLFSWSMGLMNREDNVNSPKVVTRQTDNEENNMDDNFVDEIIHQAEQGRFDSIALVLSHAEQFQSHNEPHWKWSQAMLSSLESSQAHVGRLREQVENEQQRNKDLESQIIEQQAEIAKLLDSGLGTEQIESRIQVKALEEEIADYEVYKQVMETAVVKLQYEIDAVTTERDKFKLQLQRQRRELLKDGHSALKGVVKKSFEAKIATISKELEHAKESLAFERQHHQKQNRDALAQIRDLKLKLSNAGDADEHIHQLSVQLEEFKCAAEAARSREGRLHATIRDLKQENVALRKRNSTTHQAIPPHPETATPRGSSAEEIAVVAQPTPVAPPPPLAPAPNNSSVSPHNGNANFTKALLADLKRHRAKTLEQIVYSSEGHTERSQKRGGKAAPRLRKTPTLARDGSNTTANLPLSPSRKLFQKPKPSWGAGPGVTRLVEKRK